MGGEEGAGGEFGVDGWREGERHGRASRGF